MHSDPQVKGYAAFAASQTTVTNCTLQLRHWTHHSYSCHSDPKPTPFQRRHSSTTSSRATGKGTGITLARVSAESLFLQTQPCVHSFLWRYIWLIQSQILCSILKWCWSRMPGGVVTWPVYHGFSLGERGSYSALNTSLRQRANSNCQTRTWQGTPSIPSFL